MSAEIVAIANQKGGVGKSTTAAAVGAGLRLRGRRVLFVDLDQQGNLSAAMGARPGGLSSFNVIAENRAAADAIQRTEQGDLIPAGNGLATVDMILSGVTGREYRLKEGLAGIMGDYDFIILDTPPALGMLTVNAMTAAQRVIIPAQADVFSLHGVAQLAKTIQDTRKYCNPSLRIGGILLTRYNGRTILSRNMSDRLEAAAESLGTRLYHSFIRESVAVKEAQAMATNIFDYAPKSNGAKDYDAFISEFLQEE